MLPYMQVAESVALRSAIRASLWRRGILNWKLDAGQRGWLEAFERGDDGAVWLVGRQRGKSFAALAHFLQFGLQNPGSVLRYCAKTKDSAWGIVGPTLKLLCADKPDDVRVKTSSQRADVLEIGEGSELVIFGTDAQSFDRGRGPRTHRQALDECGFYQDLVRVEAALLPSLQTTGGKALYLSTPPESMGHPYVARIRAAQASGRLVRDTFWSNPRVNHEAIIAQEASRLGMTREELLASTYFRREYLAELVQEESRAAVPGWATHAEKCIQEVPRPQFFDAYEGLDLGFSPDPHAVVFGWLDFPRSAIVIEDELELRMANTEKLADAVKAKEAALWGSDKWEGKLRAIATMNDVPEWLRDAASPNAPPQPYLRVGDNDPLALADLHQKHRVSFFPTRKDEKHLAVDELDILVRQHRLIINPRCKRLIEQLHTTTWDRQRNGWERTDRDHGDLLDALIYLVRNVSWHRDPRPANFVPVNPDVWMPVRADPLEGLRAMMGKRR